MHIQTHGHQTVGIKFYIADEEVEMARTYLYFLQNDLHEEPFGYIEDVFTHAEYRGNGYASQLLDEVVVYAREYGCYKLILVTSKKELEGWYSRHGFIKKGIEMRIDL